MQGLAFGWRTALLSEAVALLLVLAVAIAQTPVNRAANRILALLLIVLAGVLTPWMIGFAGFYDRWRWLTFAPFSITLAVGPLIWLYLRALTDGATPAGAKRHLAAPLAQFAYLSVGFLLPQPLKDGWADASSTTVAPVIGIAAAASLAAYGVAGLRLLHRYRRRLADQRSDDARYALRWVGRAIVATLVLLPGWTLYAVWDAVAPLGYVRLMGLYGMIAVFAVYLGVEGWRNAGLVFPVEAPGRPEPSSTRNWTRLGETWAELVRTKGWALEPELSLAGLAARLGTNTGYLSRALNDGLGLSFSDFINGLRSEAVAQALDGGDARDLLQLAFDAGFASKASFNRAFKARFGQSPSAYRRHVSDREKSPAMPQDEARAEETCVTTAA